MESSSASGGGVEWPDNHPRAEHRLALNKQQLRLVLLGLLASFTAFGLLILLIPPGPGPGRLEFKNFSSGRARALFLYHPPQHLKGSCLLLYTFENEAGSDVLQEYSYLSPREKVPFAVVHPTNAVWRFKALVFVESNRYNVLYGIRSLIRTRRLSAWNSRHSYYLGSVVSDLITNPPPNTVRP